MTYDELAKGPDPGKTGVRSFCNDRYFWIPAFTGMTRGDFLPFCGGTNFSRALKNSLFRQAVQKRPDARRAQTEERGVYEKYVKRGDCQRNLCS